MTGRRCIAVYVLQCIMLFSVHMLTQGEVNDTAHLGGNVFDFRLHFGFAHVNTTTMKKVFRENMDLDFAFWQNATLNMSMFEETADHLRPLFPDCYKRILIYNNQWYYADQENMKTEGWICPDPCNGRYPDVHAPLSRAMLHPHFKMPNALFLFNVCDGDQRHCSVDTLKDCKVPIFQMLKYAKEGDTDTPILVPLLEHQPPIHMFPWEAKADKAFFRGSPTPPYGISHFDVHVRALMANLSLHYPSMLDVGLTFPYEGYHPSVRVNLTTSPRALIKDHARYRYLLALDGVVASYRFSKLMAINSIILKQYSHWIEFYYRSLKEGKNYFSIVKDHIHDILEVLPRVREFAKNNPAEAQTMILENLDFYQRHLTLAPRLVYWKEALTRYRKLFPDMDDHIAKYLKKHDIPMVHPPASPGSPAGDRDQ